MRTVLFLLTFSSLGLTAARHKSSEFELAITSNSPVILDSIISFTAQLYKSGPGDKPVDANKYLFIWNSDVNFDNEVKKVEDLSCQVDKEFPSLFSDAGLYNMTVGVYKRDENRERPVARGSVLFNLTNKLNGRMLRDQELKHRDNASMFSTEKPVKLHLQLTDKFSKEKDIQFYWYFDESFLPVITTVPSIERTFSSRGVKNVTLVAHVRLKNPGLFSLNKQGTFSTFLHLEDPVKHVALDGENSTVKGKDLHMNLTFYSSTQPVVTWHLLYDNDTVVKNATTTMNVSSSCDIEEEHTFNCLIVLPSQEPGNYTLNITITNSVSVVNRKADLKFDSPAPPPSPEHSKSNVALPVIMTLLGVIIILAAVISIIRIRKKKPVEVADFDFHPALGSNNSIPVLSRVITSVQHLYNRNKYETNHTFAPPPRCGKYGTFESSSSSDQLVL